jgi:hypothetical protein
VAVVLVAAVVVAVLVFRARDGQQPPAPESGVVRLAFPASPSLPPVQQQVSLPDGSAAILSASSVDSEGGRLVGHIRVQSGAQVTTLDLGQGDSGQAFGLGVRVVHIWSMPNPRNDAIDVSIS